MQIMDEGSPASKEATRIMRTISRLERNHLDTIYAVYPLLIDPDADGEDNNHYLSVEMMAISARISQILEFIDVGENDNAWYQHRCYSKAGRAKERKKDA